MSIRHLLVVAALMAPATFAAAESETGGPPLPEVQAVIVKAVIGRSAMITIESGTTGLEPAL